MKEAIFFLSTVPSMGEWSHSCCDVGSCKCLLFLIISFGYCRRPGVANRTKSNQKPIEPNRTQSFDCSSIGSVIEHNRTGTFLLVRLSSITEPNRTQSTRLVRFCSVEKQWYTTLISINS